MSKFYGAIGYASQIESTPGVWTDVITEKFYSGDILQSFRRWSATGPYNADPKVNEDMEIDNRISVVADVFAYQNIPHIRYVSWLGTKWKVKKADIDRPRLILSLGGVYVGRSAS